MFIATKLWNNNHRPERVKPAFEASLKKLQLDYVDLYLIHTPFAFQPGDEQDPRDANGNVIYDKGVTLLDTWRALEGLVDEGKCKAIGLSDVSLAQAKEIFEAGRIKPAVVHVESHPYLPQWDLLDYCRKNGIVLQAFAALGHSSEPNLLEDPVITAIAKRVNKTPAQVLLAWAIQRGTALLTTSKTPSRIKENFEVSTLPEDAVREISEGIKSRVRFNAVVETGVPGFIPRGEMNRTVPTPWKPTKAQLLAAHNKLVPDLIAKNLIVLFAGINPGLYTAAIGRHFGRPGNRFWPALHGGGFTPRLFSPFEGSLLLDLKFGITNIVDRATARADELTDDELRAGGQRLEAKVKRWRPTVVAFVGIGPYRIVSGIKDARVGLQKAPFGGSHAWVLPNPSGLNAHYQPAALAQLFGDLRLWAIAQHGRR